MDPETGSGSPSQLQVIPTAVWTIPLTLIHLQNLGIRIDVTASENGYFRTEFHHRMPCPSPQMIHLCYFLVLNILNFPL